MRQLDYNTGRGRLSARMLPLAALLLIAGAVVPARAAETTSYAQMVARLDRDCAKSPLIRVAALGKSATGERTVWLVRLADPAKPDSESRRVLILCRQHGDEPVNTEAALDTIDQVADGKRPDIVRLLSRETVYIIPMVNPDGADAMTRENGVGADLNRDWGVFQQPETSEVYSAFCAIRPQALLDMHSWDEGDPFRGYCLEAPRADTPADPMIAQAARDLQQRGTQALLHDTGQVIAPTSYGADAEPTLCHRFFVERTNTVALLFETQPDNGGQPFARRVEVAKAAITWLAGDVAAISSWSMVAQREKRDELAAKGNDASRAAKLVFLTAAVDPPAPSPLATAVRIVRNTARRIPAAVWWALGIYALLAIMRPFVPLSSTVIEQDARPAKRRHRAVRARRAAHGRSSWRRA